MVARSRDLGIGLTKRSRYVSLLGDRREAPVPCLTCRTPTMALDALCDFCADQSERMGTDADPPGRVTGNGAASPGPSGRSTPVTGTPGAPGAPGTPGTSTADHGGSTRITARSRTRHPGQT